MTTPTPSSATGSESRDAAISTLALRATPDPDELEPFDLGIIATKATGLEDAAATLEGRFPDATMMTTLNGLGAEEVVRAHGDWPIVSAVTFMSGTKHSDTEVEYILDTATWMGPYEETPLARVEEIGDLVRRSGLEAEVLPDLRPAQWSKLDLQRDGQRGRRPHRPAPRRRTSQPSRSPATSGASCTRSSTRGRRVANAAAIELHEDPWEMNVLATRRGSAHYPSMLEDVDARRPTEIDLITGSLVREAGKHGVPVPLHTALYRLVKAKEASWRDEPEPAVQAHQEA